MTPSGKKKYSKEIVKTFKKNKNSTLQTLGGKKSYSFGKNTEKVKKEYRKEALNTNEEKLLNKLDKEALALNKKYKNKINDPTVQLKIREFNKKYYEAQLANSKKSIAIAEKYVDKFNKALIKDIKPDNYKEIYDYINSNKKFKKKLYDKHYAYNYSWFGSLT